MLLTWMLMTASMETSRRKSISSSRAVPRGLPPVLPKAEVV